MKFRTIIHSTLIVWDVPHLVSENYSDCQSIDIHFCLFYHKNFGSLPILCATLQLLKAKYFDNDSF